MTWYHPKYYAEMRKLARELRQKSSSVNQQDLLQAASFKPRAASVKLQAASNKLSDPGTTEHVNKFRGPRTEALGYDESVVRMCLMEGNLVW